MKDDEFEALERGDIIRNKQSYNSYVVCSNLGKHNIVGVRTILATNPPEWEKVLK